MLVFLIDHIKYLIISFLFFVSFNACTNDQDPVESNAAEAASDLTSSEEVGELSFQPFVNETYRFSTEIPEDWKPFVDQIGEGLPVINFIPKNKTAAIDLPVSMQTTTSLSHIDVHPKGHDSGYPIGRNHRLVLFEGSVPASSKWDRERSRVYVLGNGEVWAYVLYPKSPPAGWAEEGFIFAQIAIDNFSSDCFDDITNLRKEMDQCKPLEGDEVLYYGRVDPTDQQYILHVLESLELKG